MMKIKVKLSNGKYLEEVSNKTSVIVGRSQKSDVIVPDEALSRFHCQIDFEGENFYITDMKSANGVFIDGKRIEPEKKIQFSTYQEILIGPLELSVADSEEITGFTKTHSQVAASPEKTDEKEPLTRPTRVINRDALDKPFVSKTAPKKTVKKISPAIYLFPVILLGAGIYYQFSSTTEGEVANPETINTPQGVNLPDEFLNFSDYEAKDKSKSCSDPICKEIGLTTEAGEGVLREGQEYFIYIKASAHFDDPRFQKIKELEDKEDLIALYLALKSKVFETFRRKEILQIHVILLNPESRSQRVYRFHTKYFSANGPEKARLISELTTAFDTANSSTFWQEANPIIKRRSL